MTFGPKSGCRADSGKVLTTNNGNIDMITRDISRGFNTFNFMLTFFPLKGVTRVIDSNEPLPRQGTAAHRKRLQRSAFISSILKILQFDRIYFAESDFF